MGFVFYLFLVNEINSIKLGINGQVAYFDLWSIRCYRGFGIEDFDSVVPLHSTALCLTSPHLKRLNTTLALSFAVFPMPLVQPFKPVLLDSILPLIS